MGYRIRLTVDYDFVPDGVGSTLLGQQQADMPGYGGTETYGAVGASQTLRLSEAEVVPGANAPTQANFNTALTTGIASIATRMATAGAFSGGTQTPLAIIQGWATGNP